MAKGKSAILSVRIIGDASSAVKSFNQAGNAATGLGGRFKGMIPSWQTIAAGIGTAAIAAGKALYDIGATFDDVSDTIRTGTGATGAALDGLVDVAKNVGTNVPVEFEKIGPVVADLNTRLGLSGDKLQTLSEQYLEAGRILGEEIDIKETTAAMSAFGLSGDQATTAMDTLFRVSQGTGVGMNELAASLVKGAPAVQQLGFDFNTTAALVGTLDKAGLDADKTLTGMTRGLVNLAKSGEAPQAAFSRITGEIVGLIKSGQDAKALDISSSLFGTRNAAQFVQAIKSGALNMQALSDAAAGTGDTILGVGKETMDAAESWQILKNKALVALEPLGTAVFDGVGKALDWLVQLTERVDFSGFSGVADSLSGMSGFLGEIGTAVQEAIVPLIESLAPIIGPLIEGAKQQLTALKDTFVGICNIITGILTGDWTKVWEGIKNIVSGAVNNAISTVQRLGSLLGTILSGIGNIIVGLWNSAWQKIVDIVGGLWGRVSGAISSFKNNIVSSLRALPGRMISIGRDIINGLINGIGQMGNAAWEAAKNIASNVVGGIKSFLGIHSPSRVAAQLGSYFGIGLANGIEGENQRVTRAANALISPLSALALPDVSVPGRQAGQPVVNNYTINVDGALDPVAVARQIKDVLAAQSRRFGAIELGGAC